MKKKITTINIDEIILMKAKKEIPNLSSFIEDCLRAYLGLGEDKFVNSVQEELDNIKESQLKIHLLTQNTDLKENIVKGFDTKQQNNIWIKIWGLYRNTENISQSDVEKATQILNLSSEAIIGMMEDLKLYLPKNELSVCDDFQNALKKHELILNGMI